MRAGKGSSQAYLEEWRRQSRPIEGDVQAAVDAEIEALDAKFADDLLQKTVKAGGILEEDV